MAAHKTKNFAALAIDRLRPRVMGNSALTIESILTKDQNEDLCEWMKEHDCLWCLLATKGGGFKQFMLSPAQMEATSWAAKNKKKFKFDDRKHRNPHIGGRKERITFTITPGFITFHPVKHIPIIYDV